MSTKDIYNAIEVNDQLLTSGQPTEEQIKAAAAEGFVTIINLATLDSSRALPDEAGLVRSLGLNYEHIPVVWDSPKESDFEAFERVMQQRQDSKTLLHCAANFRVTAFYSLYAQKHLGWSQAQADEFRARIWTGSNYPVWEDFIAHLKP